jgi:hypothetical protein
MTLPWRKLALKKLLSAQEQSGLELVSTDEIAAINAEWTRNDA